MSTCSNFAPSIYCIGHGVFARSPLVQMSNKWFKAQHGISIRYNWIRILRTIPWSKI